MGCVPRGGAGCVPNMSVFGYLGFSQISCQEGDKDVAWSGQLQRLTHPVERQGLSVSYYRLQLLEPLQPPFHSSLFKMFINLSYCYQRAVRLNHKTQLTNFPAHHFWFLDV